MHVLSTIKAQVRAKNKPDKIPRHRFFTEKCQEVIAMLIVSPAQVRPETK